MFGAASIVTGIFAGIGFSYLMPLVVSHPALTFDAPDWWPSYVNWRKLHFKSDCPMMVWNANYPYWREKLLVISTTFLNCTTPHDLMMLLKADISSFTVPILYRSHVNVLSHFVINSVEILWRPEIYQVFVDSYKKWIVLLLCCSS